MIDPAEVRSSWRADEPRYLVQRAADRYLTVVAGRATRHAFSFGSHYDPDNTGFGPLLVCNDERLGLGQGYPAHAHRDAEIVTWVISGALRHTDSSGRTGVVGRGLAQRMSAGSGIVHSEVNAASLPAAHRRSGGQRAGGPSGPDPGWPEPVRFVQMWLRPDEPGGEPGYQQSDLDLSALEHGWVPLASGSDPDAAVRIGVAGAALWAGRIGTGHHRVLPTGPASFVQVVTGTVDAGELGLLAAGDTVRISAPSQLSITGVHPAELLVWTLPRFSSAGGRA